MSTSVLKISNLTIGFKDNIVVDNISYDLKKDEILGIVGESGSGKSVSSLSILGLLPKHQTSITGSIYYKDHDLLQQSSKELRHIRGRKVSMIFQNPMSSLNPSIHCGKQLQEVLMLHGDYSKKTAKKASLDLLEKVKIPSPIRAFKAYPHELSGGQKQRVMIAMAIACKPDILIADEPTTALDVTVQKEIITLLKSLKLETKMSVIFITHDLTLISEIADRILVMYKGRIVERGIAKAIFKTPQHTYTKSLINSKPQHQKRLKILPTVNDFLRGDFSEIIITKQERQEKHNEMYSKPPLLEIRDVEKFYISNPNWFSKSEYVKAVNRISFKLYEQETIGLVGESGCGKSTLAKAILQIDKPTSGEILYQNRDLTKLSEFEIKKLRKDIQIIFQDPYSSLNPRLSIGDAIMEPMKVHRIFDSKDACMKHTNHILNAVGLSEDYFGKYPHELSGGQRQRINIARAIALQPKIIICDESVSALDISVQAQVLNLLNQLKSEFGFSYVFISHDLTVVKHMADRILVMNKGRIEEEGEADDVYNSPKEDYTKALIGAMPKGLS